MYIHYNNSYQPHHQCNDHHAVHRMSGVYPDDRLYCGPGVHSPTTRDNDHDHCNHDSLSVLADTFIASAEKDRRQEGIMSLFAAKPSSSSSSQVGMMTIYSSEQEDYNNNNYQGNTTVGELSQIIKSDDSPTTSLQDGDQLVDVSFSTLADLSMLRTTSSPPSCANHLSTNGALIGMNHNIVQLSPIAAKSPDISMTPYLNCLTLDCSSQGSSRPSDTNNNNNMYIHYNNSYQPHHQCNDHHAVHRMSGVYPDDRLYCGPGVHSPTTRDNDHDHCNHDSLSVLADTFIASAEKDRRQEGIMSLFAAKPSSSSSSQVGMMTIYSSEQEDYNNNNYQGNTTVGELSQIIKSDDSPTTSLQDGDQLVDVSFSTLADLSMLRTTSSPPSCANHLSTNGALIGMNHNIVQLSPIAAKSPDISMTPYLNCLTLDCSSQGSSRPSDTNNNNNHHHHHTLNALNDAAFNALNPLSSSTSEPMPQQHEQEHEPPNLSRSLFSSTTSSKRKRASIHDYNSSSSSAGDADLLDLTNVAPFSNDAAFVSMSCMTDGGDTSQQAMNVSGLPSGLRTRTASMKLRSSAGGGGGGGGGGHEDSSLSITKEISFNDHSLVNARNGCCPSSPDPLSQTSHWSSGGPVNVASAVSASASAFKGASLSLSYHQQQQQPTPTTYSKRRRHSAVSINSTSHVSSHSSHAKSPLKLNRKEQKDKEQAVGALLSMSSMKSQHQQHHH